MATRKEQIEFIKTVYPAADKLHAAKDSLHPVFVTAQAALETGWKIKGIGHNIFGITKGSWTGRTELVLTTEIFNSPYIAFKEPEKIVGIEKTADGRYRYRVYRLFRAYDTLEDCLDDHLKVLLSGGYADAWPYRNDPKEFARRIVDGVGSKYATAPNYSATMSSVIDTVNSRLDEIRNEISADSPGGAVFFRLQG